MSAAFLDWIAFSPFRVLGALTAVLMTIVCVYPILAFARRGWWFKRDQVLASMTDSTKKLYIKTFLRQDSDHPSHDFDKMYIHRYGRYRLIVPTLILVAIILPLSFLVAETALVRLLVDDTGTLHPLAQSTGVTGAVLLPGRAVAAVIGAYVWIVYALITGASLYNMPPSLLLFSALRMIVAVPLGYAVGGLAPAGLGDFLAFAIGVFPLQTVQIILQRLANKQLGLELGNNDRPDQVLHLDGVDPPTADLLAQAGITTVAQLAYCDPVQLSLGTNLRFDAVIDLADQSLARIYLGTKLDALMPYGLRGAMEMRNLLEDASDASEKSVIANDALKAAAAAAAMPVAGLQRAFYEIAYDPYADFLCQVWNDNASSPDPGAQSHAKPGAVPT